MTMFMARGLRPREPLS